MATPNPQEAVAQQQAARPRYPLEHNEFFRRTAEPRLVEAVVTAVRGANEQGTQVSTFGKIPVIRKPYIGADMSEMRNSDWSAFHAGSPMVVLSVVETPPGGRPAARHIALGAADRLGLGEEQITAAGTGGFASLPTINARIERLRANAKLRGNTVEVQAIYITRPLDCLQFVNNGIHAAGARPVRGRSGQDLYEALGTPGRAIIENVDTLVGDPRAGASFFSAARQGDPVLFLRRLDITAGESSVMESTSNGDYVVWIGPDGRVIPRSRIEELARTDPDSVPGVSYQVRHSAMFGGNDRRTGRPLVAQSHIAAGNLSVEPLDIYVQSYGAKYGNFDAVAIISMEYFAPHSSAAVASR